MRHRSHSSTWGTQVVLPPPPQHGTFCSCGIWSCDRMGVYCDALVSSDGVRRRPEGIAELLASFDRMAELHRAAARARAEVDGSIEGGAQYLTVARHVQSTGVAGGAGQPPSDLDSQSRCAANVGRGVEIHQCTNRADASGYCWIPSHRPAQASNDFEAAPDLEPVADPFTF